MAHVNESRRAFRAGAALDSKRMVTLAGGELAYCDPGEQPLGVLEYPVATAGEAAAVRLLNGSGTVEIEAVGAVAVNDQVVTAANGTVAKDSGAGARTLVGLALTAVADGGVVEVLPYGYGHNLT
ncbi:hypothetical protein NNJEOMEG_03318 [Fundidesulfovibrio magnetotacticus]|uniref:Uncharacterized protein n=1 Tax=Fundidesulfovibrio magnetotacticus TaxID=2730080 RepID=A0A6V8M4R7_9BACT|nr:capsid cement protein [Fundidesulfovibrio magnetotacticus]GFK95455.1 hypothetical protein NNJEOMEG_03318 [Fundidesulfovibrio magnetotacticus]